MRVILTGTRVTQASTLKCSNVYCCLLMCAIPRFEAQMRSFFGSRRTNIENCKAHIRPPYASTQSLGKLRRRRQFGQNWVKEDGSKTTAARPPQLRLLLPRKK